MQQRKDMSRDFENFAKIKSTFLYFSEGDKLGGNGGKIGRHCDFPLVMIAFTCLTAGYYLGLQQESTIIIQNDGIEFNSKDFENSKDLENSDDYEILKFEYSDPIPYNATEAIRLRRIQYNNFCQGRRKSLKYF